MVKYIATCELVVLSHIIKHGFLVTHVIIKFKMIVQSILCLVQWHWSKLLL
jgi:hypothetical protein